MAQWPEGHLRPISLCTYSEELPALAGVLQEEGA